MPPAFSFEWWITYVLPLVSATFLLATLVGTIILARAAFRQAREAARQADEAARQADAALEATNLAAFVQVRPLISVTVLTASWENGKLKNLNFTVENAGQGAASNVLVSVSGYVDSWRVTATAGATGLAAGALAHGGRRMFVAEPVRSGMESGFDQSVMFALECFDVFGRHFLFEHEFLIGHEVLRLSDVGLRIAEAPSE